MSTAEIRKILSEKFTKAVQSGLIEITLVAKEIHRELNLKNQFPSVCNAMYSMPEHSDCEVICITAPPSGYGASLTIKYRLLSPSQKSETRKSLVTKYPVEVEKISSEASDEDVTAQTYESLKAEHNLRDHIVEMLRQKLRLREDIQVRPEVGLSYTLGDNSTISHNSDILITHPASKRYVSIEIKYKSAVTDQFKCRSYDAFHLKKEYGESIWTVMLFVRAGKGVSIRQAQRLSHWFDCFIGLNVQNADGELADRLVAEIEGYLNTPG